MLTGTASVIVRLPQAVKVVGRLSHRRVRRDATVGVVSVVGGPHGGEVTGDSAARLRDTRQVVALLSSAGLIEHGAFCLQPDPFAASGWRTRRGV